MDAYQTLTVENIGPRRDRHLPARRSAQRHEPADAGEITEAFEALSDDAASARSSSPAKGAASWPAPTSRNMPRRPPPEFDAFQAAGTRMYAAIEDNRKPVIAAVNGFALGRRHGVGALLRHRHRQPVRANSACRRSSSG